MNASEILNDQIIYVKRAHQNSFGWEPCWNAYFDFYLETKWFGEPLLELQDVTFHLYLRKNLNDRNKQWKMPTIRQMKKKFGISFDKVNAMMIRLDAAHLLKKESGVKKANGMNMRNNYLLSDPIPVLEEFLIVAREGVFNAALKPEYSEIVDQVRPSLDYLLSDELPWVGNRDTGGSEIGTLRGSEIGTNQQTLNPKQTLGEQADPRWQKVLNDLQFSLPGNVFEQFLGGSTLIEITDGVAVVGTPQTYARDWIENRLSDKIRRLLGVAAVRCEVVTDKHLNGGITRIV